MQKEELGMDENRNPEEELRLLGGKKEKCHNLNNRIRTGSWESNGYTASSEIVDEPSVPLSPSNSLNIRNLQLSERDPPQHTRRYPPNFHHGRPFRPAYRKTYRGNPSDRKEWGPSTNGHHCAPEGLSNGRWQHRRRGYSDSPSPLSSPELERVSTIKASEKPAVTFNASSVTTEESEKETWSLFRPLPAFPVDSSSARIIPKISYASKLKENLDQPGKACHVPASAVRTTNSLPNCVLAPPPTCSPPPTDSSRRQHLGAIFQNEWGLSFINEPGAGHGGGGGTAPVKETENADAEACWENMEANDWQAARNYHLEEWSHIWELHNQAPSRVMVYSETLDGKG